MPVRFALFCLLNALLLSRGATADPAIFRDERLTVGAAAVIGEKSSQYYRDIVLATDASGRLQVVSAVARPLVMVDSVNATVIEGGATRSATLRIRGNKSVPCVSLEEAAVSRKDTVFTVVLAETLLPAGQPCIQVLAPFELDLPLDIGGLAAGRYQVLVNGRESSFQLTTGGSR